MNQFNATIKSVETEENISIVVAAAAGINWHAMVIDNAETNEQLQEEKSVALVFKENTVSIAKNVTGLLSIRNRIPCTIVNIRQGNILSEVSLESNGNAITAIITTHAVKELNLQQGDTVEALIKTTDISLMQITP
jgi:molybdate transport system regulatory protein